MDHRHTQHYNHQGHFSVPPRYDSGFAFNAPPPRHGHGHYPQSTGGGPRRNSMKRHGGGPAHGRRHGGGPAHDYQPSLQALQQQNRRGTRKHYRGKRRCWRMSARSFGKPRPSDLRSYSPDISQGQAAMTPRQWDAPDAPRRHESFLYPTPTPGENGLRL